VEIRTIRNLTLHFDAAEERSAGLVGDACAQSLDLIRDLWGLGAPAECRVYVMTAWSPFLFDAAPWPWRIYLAVTLPLRYRRIQQMWAMAGGWALRYGQRCVIGIKPPRLLQEVDPGLRDRVFLRREPETWAQHNTCHELVHACSDHLKLPTWLHEGLAMLTVDRFAGRPTVRSSTLETIADPSRGAGPRHGDANLLTDPDHLVYLAVRGYWMTRYLAETRPTLLREQLVHRQSHETLEATLAAELGIEPGAFWREMEASTASHFGGITTPN
jgi:hypothetical protein